MVFEFRYHKAAEKFLDTQSVNSRKRIMGAINALPNGDVKKLVGCDGYRLRVGQYRVVFDIDYKLNVIDVMSIDSRGQIYK